MANSEAGTSGDAARALGGDARALGGEYDVFLSFRGPDTRHGFTDFLYHGLVDVGVHVFRDEDELRVGEVIGKNLLSAISNSIIYIIIFSQTYAYSKWCLRELAHIVDNVSKSEGRKCIIPIFFNVEPNDVKLKASQYSNALLEHEKQFPDEVEAWRAALAEVGQIKGWNVKSSQAVIVKSVVGEVLEKLKIKQKAVTRYLVGLDDRLKDLIEFLDVNRDDVRLIGIYGMGGIGKTTIAKVVYNQLCSHFGKCCSFLEGVRERSTKEGIVQLQRKLQSDIGSRSAEKVEDSEQGIRRIGEILGNKKVLVVLDDVDKKDHIKNLIGNSKLCSGSRIIITTRDTTVMQVEGFKGEILCYEMLRMVDGPALQLFCRHAFGGDFPLDNYHGLSSEIVSSTGGLPLAIEVIGSLLNGKDQEIWEETLDRLRKVPEQKILEKLRISYDDLEEHHKQIFLDISCFFFNENKTDAIYMWTDCQFYPKGGIKVLTDRCLIKILDNDKFWMHDQLIALGRRIVHEDSQGDLRKQSRLWIAKEAFQIIKTKERKDKVQGLSMFDPPLYITNEDLERLQNLRFLELGNATYAGDFARCRSNLRWFSWHSPRDFGAVNLHLDCLVVCKLDAINFKDDSKAWDLIKRAPNLKVLSNTRCSGITTIPDISKCSSLERLTLEQCSNLKIIESYIGDLQSLIELKIEKCCNFTDLPKEVGALVKLKHFSLWGCRRFRELPGSLSNLASLTELWLSDTNIRELPNFIGKLKLLRILSCRNVGWEDHVWRIPSSINTLANLQVLRLSGCNVRGEIPVGIGELLSLRILELSQTSICGIPRTINVLYHLQELNLSHCHDIQELPELPTSLTDLSLQSKSLISVPNLSNLTNLVELELSDGSRITKKSNLIIGCNLMWIGRLSRLKRLELNLLNVPAPPELASLSHLEELQLSCLNLKSLVQLPPYWRFRKLSTLRIFSCEVEDIPLDGLPLLEDLEVWDCEWLQRLIIPLELMKLRRVSVTECPELVEIQFMGLLKSLEYLMISYCKTLTKVGGLQYLKNLEKLDIEMCNVLTDVEGLNKLESLKHLRVRECTSLRRLIDVSCTSIPDDCCIQIQECGDFVKDSIWIPESSISLKRYKEVVLPDTSNQMNYPFTIKFFLGVIKKYGEKNGFSTLITEENKDVTPDSVTYEGLIADVKGFGFHLKRMWHQNHRNLLLEITSDEQVKEMVQLASQIGLIHLHVEVCRPGLGRYPGGWSIFEVLCRCFCGLCFGFGEPVMGRNSFVDNGGPTHNDNGRSTEAELAKDLLVIEP